MNALHRGWKRILSFASLCLCLLWILLLTSPARAQSASHSADTSYLKEMPDVARVLADSQGTDALDTAARQCAALSKLEDFMSRMTGNQIGLIEGVSPEERSVWWSYRTAKESLQNSTWSSFNNQETQRLGENSPRAKWTKSMWAYEANPEFEKKLLERYLSPELRERYQTIRDTKRQQDAQAIRDKKRAQEVERILKAPDETAIIEVCVGLVLVAIGLLILPRLLFRLQSEAGAPVGAESKDALTLPDALRFINVYRKKYEVFVQSGLVYNVEIWTETHATTTTSGGGAYTAGGNVYVPPASAY